MGHEHCTAKERENKHLKYRERLRIEVMRKEKSSSREIALTIGCSIRTVQREIRRGQVEQLKGSTWEYYSVYDADFAQDRYRQRQGGSGPGLKIGHDHKLAQEIEKQLREKRSPDVIADDIRKRHGEFSVCLCTRTIYNYLEKNLFLGVSWKDLTYGHYQRKKDRTVNRPSYKNLKGRSIEQRREEVNQRIVPGHWEMDLVVGGKRKGTACLLVLTERMSRREIIRKLPDRSQQSVIRCLDALEKEWGARAFRKQFRTITVDNGSEFLDSRQMERSCISRGKARTEVYYAHPYSAFERGSNENLNRMIRRFIPKGADIRKYTKQQIHSIEQWLNTYPRKILNFSTPQEVYQRSFNLCDT